MAAAGIAWGIYSLLGRAAGNPFEATAMAFVTSVPPTLHASAFFVGDFHLTGGLALALASDALASSCGYVAWYEALAGLTAGRAAIVQLSVPAIAAFGGVVLFDEALTLRLLLASAAILGGITIVLTRAADAQRA